MSNQSKGKGLSNEQRRLIRHKQKKADPRYYLRYEWSHPNRPEDNYDFRTNDGERKLEYLLDDEGPLKPENWGNINLLLMARGCLKSTSLIGIYNWALDMIPSVDTYMIAPTRDPPVSGFIDKFRNNARNTPLYDNLEKESLSHHKFSQKVPDGNGGSKTTYSSLKTQTAFNPDRIRGPHVAISCADEFQDISQESFSMLLQVTDQSLPNEDHIDAPIIFLIGTPKEKNSLFHELWLKSDQASWDGDEKEWVQESEVGEYRDDSDDSDIDHDSFTVRGWHIDQPNSPLQSHNPSKVEFNRKTYSERQFTNECLAKFYSPQDDLLGQEDVLSSFQDGVGFRNSRRSEESKVVLTADWGGGSGKDAADTVFTAAELIEDEEQFIETDAYCEAIENDITVPYQIYVLDHEFLDHGLTKPEEEDKFREWVEKFQPDDICIDQGHNGSRRDRLRDTYGDIVKGIKYGNVSPPTDIRWKENEIGETIIGNVDKTHVCEKMVDNFKDGRYVIPSDSLGSPEERGSDAQKLISQLTSPFEEQKQTTSGNKRLYIQSERNDDSFDTFVYQYVGMDFMAGLTPNISASDLDLMARAGY